MKRITTCAALVYALCVVLAIACGCSAATASGGQSAHAAHATHTHADSDTAQLKAHATIRDIDLSALEAAESAIEALPDNLPTEEQNEVSSASYDAEITYSDYDAYYDELTYYASAYDNDFQSVGVVYGEDGTRYTWYSQNVLPGGGLMELNNNGRHVDERGFVCDGDGYIAVASNDYDLGTVVNTPFGAGKVYDGGCDSGTIDVYTDF